MSLRLLSTNHESPGFSRGERQLKNTHDAQDVCQTVFVKLLTESRTFDTPAHERAYILRMAANACKDLLKSPWRKRTCGLDDVLEVPAPEAADESVLAAC